MRERQSREARRVVRLFAALPPGGARALEPRRDLLLPDDPKAGPAPPGTLMNDWLDREARVRVREDADRMMADWRRRVDGALTRDGICLPSVHTWSLHADVFLRIARITPALQAFVAAERPDRVEIHSADPVLGAAIAGTLDRLAVSAVTVGSARAPIYPIGFSRAVRRGRLAPLREALGFPGRPRGSVLIQPFRNLQGLWTALPALGAHPVLDPALLPPLPPREVVARGLRGGFIGNAGGVALRRSRAALTDALASIGDQASSQDDPAVALADRRAIELLRQLAGGTFAQASVFRAAARQGVRVAVVPTDTAPYARTFGSATRDLGGTLVAVQHGFSADLLRVGNALIPYADGAEAARVAVWSDRDTARLRDTAAGKLIVTGNPGTMPVPDTRPERTTAALVLLQPVGPTELFFDVRSAHDYVETALAGLSAAGFTGPVVLRPHPLDRMCHTDIETHDLHTSIDGRTPLIDALRAARLCIGTASTATLEAVYAGVPTVFLDVTGARMAWPFDRSGALPRAFDVRSLADTLSSLGTQPEAVSQAAAQEALGARPGALERVADLIVEATR